MKLLPFFPNKGQQPYHIFTRSKPKPGFLMSYVVVLYVFNDFKWEVVVHFVDIDGMADQYCLIFLFIIQFLQGIDYYQLSFECKNRFL